MKKYGEIFGSQAEIDLKKGIDTLNLSSVMEDMVCRLWSNTYVIDTEKDSSFFLKIHNRVLTETPPSSEKQQYKDCYIWETFLTLCDCLSNKGTAYFMTENTIDYCGKKSKIPLPDIQKELDAYCANIEITKWQLLKDLRDNYGIFYDKNKLNE